MLDSNVYAQINAGIICGSLTIATFKEGLDSAALQIADVDLKVVRSTSAKFFACVVETL